MGDEQRYRKEGDLWYHESAAQPLTSNRPCSRCSTACAHRSPWHQEQEHRGKPTGLEVKRDLQKVQHDMTL